MLTSWGVAQENENTTAVPPEGAQQVSTSAQATKGSPAETGSSSAGLGPIKMAWDTTVKYSPMFRVAQQSNTLISDAVNPNVINLDDGDRNFATGLVSSRVDVFSEMDVTFGDNFGVRASTEAWGDPIYNARTANTSPLTYNALSTSYLDFPVGTKDFLYLNVYLMDAFVHAKLHVGNTTLNLRAGQFAQQWGQTLFFGGNGIAGAMAPVDVIKLLTEPNAMFKEIILPVPQFSLQWQLSPKVSIGGYYQGHWRKTWLPPVGSYFSASDVFAIGNERLFMSPLGPNGLWLVHRRDDTPKNSGQFGAQLLIKAPNGWDLGFYGAQFHDKTPQNDVAVGDPKYFSPTYGKYGPQGAFGSYGWIYAEDIKTIGVSASKTLGWLNWAAELSGRWHQDLTLVGTVDPGTEPYNPYGATVANNTTHQLYPNGDIIEGNMNVIAAPPPTFISKEAFFAGEVAWNHCISITQNEILPTTIFTATGSIPYPFNYGYFQNTQATHDAMVFMLTYAPAYRQVLSGTDLSFPVGFQFSPYGRSVFGPGFNTYHGGFFNIGADIAYRDVNRFSITYQRFIGPQAANIVYGDLQPVPGAVGQQIFSYGQSMGDRNFIVLSIYRSFGVRASQKAR
jgi:hypothetical protein